MCSQRVHYPSREDPSSSRLPFFDQSLARIFNGRGGHRRTSRQGRHRRGGSQPGRSSIRRQPHNRRGSRVSRNNAHRSQGTPAVHRPREADNTQLPPAGPPTHISRRTPRLIEESQHYASYGHYGTNPSALVADTGQAQSSQLSLGGIAPSMWSNPSFLDTAGAMGQYPPAVQMPSSAYPSQDYSNHGYTNGLDWERVGQLPAVLPSPTTTFTFPVRLPAGNGTTPDFTMTGPNQLPQRLRAAININYEVSFLTARAAIALGCEWEVCPPTTHATRGPASLIEPSYWVQGLSVSSQFFGIQGMGVSLYILPDDALAPLGADIIVGQSMMEMMISYVRGRDASAPKPPNPGHQGTPFGA